MTQKTIKQQVWRSINDTMYDLTFIITILLLNIFHFTGCSIYTVFYLTTFTCEYFKLYPCYFELILIFIGFTVSNHKSYCNSYFELGQFEFPECIFKFIFDS